MNDIHKKTLITESPEILELIDKFKRDFPNATEKQKSDFKDYLKRFYVYDIDYSYAFGITDDDPFKILSSDGKFGIINNEYEQAEFIAKLNIKKQWETDADVTVKDLLYKCAVTKLLEQGVDISPDITNEWNEENEAYREWCNKAHTSPKTANKPVKEQYVYAPDIHEKKYKWYRVTETGLEEAPDYIPPDDTK